MCTLNVLNKLIECIYYINNQSGELTVIITNADNTSLSGFNKATKSYMLSKYSYECSIPN